jgi:hypothetical protein
MINQVRKFFLKKTQTKKNSFFLLNKKNNFYSSIFSYIFFNHTLIVAPEFLLVPPIRYSLKFSRRLCLNEIKKTRCLLGENDFRKNISHVIEIRLIFL